ncbi:hypothetical protein C7121_26940 [Paenibacillus glucanolyticus]|jgi:hypothetical protein|uniref:Uncharacterized protein n=1 Tax=Paenibacillus glucanolyticus TaxID=59843 RepID=A0A163L4D8_9BACL|nr:MULTISPECIES: hypothetical protein [Paenibacillus]ANA81762.1 hypothetical protein A3958_18110 [Paenibacillus glucanolyticus]AVV59507.1 hypothetical protein C7121_26940 [Paenibacillus glucanolyticus]ETT43173.1 hypothetical protein C169_00520 [Paenibacillus sp. FSL R5-808]KZS47803.1 hypothetical protein AWU65_18715 [Paenibacillus glucanolyticus]MPY15957.1 hypothetical protein [Paenibacillus glucanolyticus]
MRGRKSHRFKQAGLLLSFIVISTLGSGCSIPERTSVQLEPLHAPAAPVLLDVYSRSVEQDVYSKPGSGSLEPVSPMDSEDTLHDLNP